MWIYFAIAFKPLFCSQSPKGICHLCLLCNLLGVFHSNLQSDLHLNPFGLFGLKMTSQNNILQSRPSSSVSLTKVFRSVGCGTMFERSAFQCWFTRYPGSNRLICQMRRKWTADNPYKFTTSDRKWVCAPMCVHVWQTGICNVSFWSFKSCGVFPPCTVWKTEERSEESVRHQRRLVWWRTGLFHGYFNPLSDRSR